MTDGGSRRLLEPGRIGSMELRNRILMCPMGDALADPDGTVNDRQVAYYGARARGGTALIIMGSVSVGYPHGCYTAGQTGASDDRFLPGLRRIAGEIHGHGAKIAAQIVHDGGNSRFDTEQGFPVLVPSVPRPDPPDRLSGMVTPGEVEAMMRPFTTPTSKFGIKVADEDDIAQLIESFASAAERLVRAGFDGIELHAGHGYILDAFLSPASNQRDDRWGGSLDNRARLLLEVIGAVRSRLGGDVPLWMRVNAEERHRPGGETLPDMLRVIDMAVAAGLDAVHVSTYSNPMVGIGICDAHTPQDPGHLRPNFRAVKASVTVPVIAYGRLEPELAEEVLESGDADFVAMGRQLLADPDLPNKLARGERDDIRPCIYQYRCINGIFVNETVRCAVNAATADGDEDGPPAAARPRHVLVVGGGAAGMEAARLLAASGHRVTLADGATELGGRLITAAEVDPQMAALLGWLRRQVSKAGVELRLGTHLDAAGIAAIGADEVVDASGAPWPGLDAFAAEWPSWPRSQSLTIEGGDKPAMSLAVRAAKAGIDVTVVEPSGVFAQRVGLPGRARFVHDAEQAGVHLATERPEGSSAFDLRPAEPMPIGHIGAHLVGDVTGTWGVEPAFQQARALARLLAR